MPLIYMRLAWKRLPKFQHLLNDRQKRQKYPVKFEFPDPIVWKEVRGGEVRKSVSTEATIREKLALTVGVQTTFGFFNVRSRLVES